MPHDDFLDLDKVLDEARKEYLEHFDELVASLAGSPIADGHPLSDKEIANLQIRQAVIIKRLDED